MPDSINCLNHTPMFEWCVIRCGSKNGHQLDMLSTKEIGLCAQNMLPILNNEYSWGNLYTHLMSMRIFIMIMNIKVPKTIGKVAIASN